MKPENATNQQFIRLKLCKKNYNQTPYARRKYLDAQNK